MTRSIAGIVPARKFPEQLRVADSTLKKIMKLTSIETISEISPIENADRIEKVTILGWSCIVRKGLYSVGDTVIFVFPDTLVPKRFLDNSYEGKDRVRLRTVKMRGHFSAGLVLPLSVLDGSINVSLGDDVADHLNITKYEAPVDVTIEGDSVGSFPSFIISKTDEDNARSNPEAIKELESCYMGNLVLTTKWDGRSSTYIWTDGKLRCCSRSLEKKEGECIEWRMARKYELQEKFSNMEGNWAIQSEACGIRVQKNLMGLKENEIRVFHVKNLDTGEFFTPYKVEEFCNTYNLPYVGIISEIDKSEFLRSFQDGSLQSLVDSITYPNGYPAEGVVFKTVYPFYSSVLGKPWSVKLISQVFDSKN